MRRLLILMLVTFFSCNQSTKENNIKEQKEAVPESARADTMNSRKGPTDLSTLFSLSDAEKILGEPAHLTDSATTNILDTLEYRCAYKANSENRKTHKTGAIYVGIEQYSNVSIAKEIYSSIKKSNEHHEGIKILEGFGDEAYFHSDGENFYFILSRKGEKTLRMKVNKITSTTSVDNFNLIAKRITDSLSP